MALRMNPVRLLIADDVGIGKTIEAGMIARELLDRGIVRRLAVICPPHLCDQWEQELREKFNLDTAVIQPSRIGRLEREVPRQDVSIYQYYRHLVVSIDYIKSDRNRHQFIDNAPDLIIVDEAHSSQSGEGTKSLKSVLASRSLEEAEDEEAGAETPEEELDNTILAEMEKRGPLPNLSMFAFTSTPKPISVAARDSANSSIRWPGSRTGRLVPMAHARHTPSVR